MPQECIPCAPAKWCKDGESGDDHGLCTCFQSDAREERSGEGATDRWCRGCWCAPCMAGQTQSVLNAKNNRYYTTDPGLCSCQSACYGWICAQSLASGLDQFTMGLLSACVPAVFTGSYLTGKVREERDPSSKRSCQVCTCDFLCGYFCGCCMTIKNYRDAKALAGVKPAPVMELTKVGHVFAQPVAQPREAATREPVDRNPPGAAAAAAHAPRDNASDGLLY